MKILLTGKNGQVGFELQRSLAVLGEVHAVDTLDCNMTQPAAIRKLIKRVMPNIIVNPAAYTAVDKAENDAATAEAVNAVAPGILAEEAEALGAILIHYSTDYVFDGIKTNAYTENDTPNPQSVYGVTKLAGEQAIQALCSRHVILRTSWVVGTHGNNFAKTILRLAAERDHLEVISDQIGAPTSAALLADVTAHIVRQMQLSSGPQFPFGLYHATAGGRTNWYDYACHVINQARHAGHPIKVLPGEIIPITTTEYPTPAKRPTNSVLNTDKLHAAFGLRLPDWHNGIDHILRQILRVSI